MRGRSGITVATVVRLGQLEGGGHEHLGPDGPLYLPALEEESGQG